jgi:hypothetical protein
LKKVNKKRTVTVRRVFIFWNISRHPLLIWLHLLSSSVQNSEGSGDGDGGHSCADPCQEFKQGFLGVSSSLPLVSSFSRICLNISEGDMNLKNWFQNLWEALNRR